MATFQVFMSQLKITKYRFFLVMLGGNTTGTDSLLLNLESAWSGGPFQPGIIYTGGNPSSPVDHSVWNTYRAAIWQSPNGTIPSVDNLMEEIVGYGTYAGVGSLDIVQTASNASSTTSDYVRWLDLTTGTSGVQWTEGGKSYKREYFCSNPSKTCVVHQQSPNEAKDVYTVGFNPLAPSVTNITCTQGSTSSPPLLTARGVVPSDPVTTTGMIFEIQTKVFTSPPNLATCSQPSGSGAKINIPSGGIAFTIMTTGNTDFSLDAGDAAHGYTFKGNDPHIWVSRVVDEAVSSATTEANAVHAALRKGHNDDYVKFNDFELNLGGDDKAVEVPTDKEIAAYEYNIGSR